MIDVNKPLGIWRAGLYHLIVLHLSRVGIFFGGVQYMILYDVRPQHNSQVDL